MKIATVVLGALLCLQLHSTSAFADQSDEALVAAAEQLVAESGEGDTSMEKAAVLAVMPEKSEKDKEEKKELKESEIPVVMSAKKAGEEKGGSIWRMVASLAVVAVTAALGLYATKRWGRNKDKGGQKARIEMMHQFHLGPRKSIGLIRVAGEAILVGITDQNINMIKSVALIDDELENTIGKDFNTFLEDEFSIEDVRGALSPRV